MKKYILILLLLTQAVFADALKVIDQVSDIPQNKNVVLIFSMKFCPYCIRQEKSIVKNIQPKFQEIEYLKVMKGTKVFQELIQTGNFGEVEVFPTTYILKKNKNNSLNVKYPFTGFQRSSNIIAILNDKDIMED
jgi:thioredoxin-related protein